MPTKQQLAAQELLLRREKRRDLNAWAVHCGYEPAEHHRLINDYLTRLSRREFTKLIITMPPGSAKSTYASKLLPPWYLSEFPSHVILAIAATSDLAKGFGRACRNLIQSNSPTLGYSLCSDSSAIDDWSVQQSGRPTDGGYFCAGIGSAIVGRRADFGIIEDPVRSREEADSKDTRDKIWNSYINDFKPRLKPNAIRLLIQTRWHEDDLAGRIIAREKGWVVLRLPMEADSPDDPLKRPLGARLWPEWFTQEMVDEAKQDERVWSCLYQENPTPETGNFFSADGIRTYASFDDLPTNLEWYIGSDHAIDEKQASDSSVILPVGIDSNNDWWVHPDFFHAKCDTKTICNEMIAFARRHEPLMWFSEAAHIEKAIGPFLYDIMEDEQVYFVVKQLSAQKSKRAKAQPLQGLINKGKIHFPSFSSKWSDFRHQLITFDQGDHDDFIDALANVARGLQILRGPRKETPKEEAPAPLSVKAVRAQMKHRDRLSSLSLSNY